MSFVLVSVRMGRGAQYEMSIFDFDTLYIRVRDTSVCVVCTVSGLFLCYTQSIVVGSNSVSRRNYD